MDGSEKRFLVDPGYDWTAVRAAWQARREREAREDGAAPDPGWPLAEPPPDQAVEAASRSSADMNAAAAWMAVDALRKVLGAVRSDHARALARLKAAEDYATMMLRASNHWLGVLRNLGARVQASGLLTDAAIPPDAWRVLAELAAYVPGALTPGAPRVPAPVSAIVGTPRAAETVL